MSTHAAAGGMMQERSLDKPEVSERLGTMLLDLLGNIPRSDESESDDPVVRARKLAHTAARKAALTSGTLALPPGALGWLTVIPELIAIWKLQAQMVSDIAAIFGSKALLTREHMLYCLFRHTAAQAVRDLVVRMGQRFLVQQVSHGTLTRVARQIGVRMTQHALGKGIARWVPVAGAVGVGAYAYYDTLQVAFTATQLFRRGPPPADRTPRLMLPRTQR